MTINKDALSARINNLSRDKGISASVLYPRFFFDSFLKRLSLSEFKDRYVLKGGLYLSSLTGVEKRSTMDIDFLLRKERLSQKRLIDDLKAVSSMDIGDGVQFEYVSVDEIRKDDLYGGYSLKFIGKLDNVRQTFSVDIATGDPIVPGPTVEEYTCLITGEQISLLSYSLESYISEKVETVLSRANFNSRSKDFYDLYLLWKTGRQKVSVVNLRKAFEETCKHRGFTTDPRKAFTILEAISHDKGMKARWDAYARKHDYSKGLPFEEATDAVRRWCSIVFDSDSDS